jgi:hypothetical protein
MTNKKQGRAEELQTVKSIVESLFKAADIDDGLENISIWESFLEIIEKAIKQREAEVREETMKDCADLVYGWIYNGQTICAFEECGCWLDSSSQVQEFLWGEKVTSIPIPKDKKEQWEKLTKAIRKGGE